MQKHKKDQLLKDTEANDFEVENIFPAFEKNSINLVFSADETYISYLAVAIASIIENSSLKYNYDVVILHQTLQDYQKRFILSLAENVSNISIRFFNMEMYVEKYSVDSLGTFNHITFSSYFRLFIGKIFSQYSKILYLDCDLVVNKDIAELFNIDMGKYPVAAAKDTIVCNSLICPGFDENVWNDFKKYMNDSSGFRDITNYFNSGVMIINIAKYNEVKLEYLLNVAKKNSRYFLDQNVMNAVFENNYYLLPPAWNLQWHVGFLVRDFKQRLLPELLDLYENSEVMPNIIHYTSHIKPWNNPHHTFADIWWKYARKTPFYETFVSDLCKYNLITTEKHGEILGTSDLRKIMDFNKHKMRYIRYSILSVITFGKYRKTYEQKKQKMKKHLEEVKHLIKKA